MYDMDPADIVGAYREHVLHYHDGRTRRVLVSEVETPYPDGRLIVSRTDPTGIITHANESFVEMSGYRREELIGQPHCILRHPDMPAAAFQDLWQTLARGEKWHGYVKNLRKDGGYYWVYATVIANVRHGQVVGYTSVRRKPARRKVEEMAMLYRSML
ncbi:MAG TPA: PAS domain-containing protein [Candidatus Competibacteraceae bacterium]|nr:PAS domain-containing protein [Candidatus Competibacteraceae bacterium]